MNYKINFDQRAAAATIGELYYAYQRSEDSFDRGDLPRNIVNITCFEQSLKALRMIGADTEVGTYSDSVYTRIGYARINSYVIVCNNQLDVSTLEKAIEELAKQDKYREIRKMDQDSLRGLCISEHWCTRATNAEYQLLLDMTDSDNLATDTIAEMAKFILAHSSGEMDFENVCFKLLTIGDTFICEN